MNVMCIQIYRIYTTNANIKFVKHFYGDHCRQVNIFVFVARDEILKGHLFLSFTFKFFLRYSANI